MGLKILGGDKTTDDQNLHVLTIISRLILNAKAT